MKESIQMEIDEELALYKKFMVQLKENGYREDYYLVNLYEMHILCDMKKVRGMEVKNLWTEYFSDDNRKNEKLNLFVAMPYCHKKCSYCIYHKGIPDNDQVVKDYARNVVNQIEFFKDTLSRRKFTNLYFGGGTPSLFAPEDLKRVSEALFKYAHFNDGGEKTCECNPQSTTFEKLEILKNSGFNKISFGVQTLNPRVLESINRAYQTEESVLSAVNNCKVLGFDQVNTDMIIGFAEDTKDELLESFDKILKCRPTKIRMYNLHPPDSYLEMNFQSSLKVYHEHFVTLFEAVPIMIEKAKKVGYEVPDEFMINQKNTSAINFILKSAKVFTDRYSYTSDGNDSLFGIGHHAGAYIRNTVKYHSVPLTENAKENQYNLVESSPRQELLLFLLDRFSDNGYISIKECNELFHIDVLSEFKDEFKKLSELGVLKYEGDNILFSPDRAEDKFLYGLFLVGKKKILGAIEKYFTKNKIKVVIGNNELIYHFNHLFNENRKDVRIRLDEKDFSFSRDEAEVFDELQKMMAHLSEEFHTLSVDDLIEVTVKRVIQLLTSFKRHNRELKLNISKR